jgi:pimeloyl-ACP methyl ester carboxylesterase
MADEPTNHLGFGRLDRPDGHSIAYRKVHAAPGQTRPGVIFLHGLRSDQHGGKCIAVENYCREKGVASLRFDQFGHGESTGDFPDGTLSRWAEDTVAVIDALTDGPQILVGSSMGGWVMLLAALKRPERIAGLLGIAPAPDFTEDLMYANMTPAQKQQLRDQGYYEEPTDYDDAPYIISQKLIQDGRQNLLLDNPIPITCPVHILHGQQDDAVPWQRSLKLMHLLESQQVETTFIKSGDHRLSENTDIQRMLAALDRLLG